jgi:hypothetical protein
MVACGLLAIALNLSVPAEAQTYEFKLTGTVVTSTRLRGQIAGRGFPRRGGV